MAIVDFPSHPQAFRNRKQISDYLRTIADHIEKFETDTDPESILLVLVGKKQFDILHTKESKQTLREAANKAAYHFGLRFNRRGGNVYER
jgi:hypothetical protein